MEGSPTAATSLATSTLLFRGTSPDFIHYSLSQPIAKLTRTPRRIQSEQRIDGARFHGRILHGNALRVTTQDNNHPETPRHHANTVAVRLHFRRRCDSPE